MSATLTTDAPRPRRRSPLGGAPLVVQVVGLLIAGLVIAQAAAVAVVMLVPPDRSVFRKADIVAALQGGPLHVGGRALIRTLGPKPLERTSMGWVPMPRVAYDLAVALDASPRDVAVHGYVPPPFIGAGFGRRPDMGPPPEDSGGRRPGPRWADAPAGRLGFEGLRGDAAPPPRLGFEGLRGDAAPPPRFERLHDSFAVAWRRPDGVWVNIQPAPNGLLSAWQRGVLMWFLGSFALLGPLGYLFARRLAAPIRAFARAADSLGRDPRTPLPPLDGPAEIGVAARAFNRMQAQLQRYVEGRTAMVGAISHDLRTPLSRIRFKLEGAPEPMRAAVLSDVAQMEEMISSVLVFIRDGAEPARRERLDLRSLVECEVDEAALVGGAVTLEPGDSLTIEADPIGVQRVVANLIGNALKYAGRAEVRLSHDEGEAVIEIADDGPGIAPGELERVFRPFYRAEAARTLDAGGIGLGLAVARSIARAHGGDVQLRNGSPIPAEDSPGRHPGLLAEVRLPLAPAPARR